MSLQLLLYCSNKNACYSRTGGRKLLELSNTVTLYAMKWLITL